MLPDSLKMLFAVICVWCTVRKDAAAKLVVEKRGAGSFASGAQHRASLSLDVKGVRCSSIVQCDFSRFSLLQGTLRNVRATARAILDPVGKLNVVPPGRMADQDGSNLIT